MNFKEGDLVKWIIPPGTKTGLEILIGKAMRVSKITKDEIHVEYNGDTYGFFPDELEHTSKLHEQLK